MKVQRIKGIDGKVSWAVIDESYRPILEIASYVKYLEGLERSQNTIQRYVRSLKLFWEFLEFEGLLWTDVKIEKVADFIVWLRRPDSSVISIEPQEAKRTEGTINNILSAVYGFYDFHHRLGNVQDLNGFGLQARRGGQYKPFLHHITKGKPVQTRLLKLKAPKKKPQTLSSEEVETLINACKRYRDKFLLCLLYQTGMRIGQALGLRHGDISSWDNEITIVPRTNNANGARAKTRESYVVHVNADLMALYSEYLLREYPEDLESDYVFINIWDGKVGHPMNQRLVNRMFERLSKKTGIQAHPHMLRHSHATELLRSGWDAAHVQKRLGHADPQTTISTYIHLSDEDMKNAYHKYLKGKE